MPLVTTRRARSPSFVDSRRVSLPDFVDRRARSPSFVDREDDDDVEWYNDPRRDPAWERALTRTTTRSVDIDHGSQAHSSSRAILPASRRHGGPERSATRVIPPPPPPAGQSLPSKSAAVPAARRVHLVHDPSDSDRDITVRLKMDLEEDWEGDLEEFCHLRRLGRFNEAREHWWGSTLKKRSADPYVQVQYAEMLLAAGDYRGLRELPVLSQGSQDRARSPSGEGVSKLAQNYLLLRLLSHGVDYPDRDIVYQAGEIVTKTLDVNHSTAALGSTEIQLIVLSLRAVAQAELWAPHYKVPELWHLVQDPRLQFRRLYRLLAGEGRIWDFRDLLLAAARSMGWEDASERFFGPASDTEVVNTILEDWARPGFDEGSTLGLLDLFTSLILQDPRKYLKPRNSLLLQEAEILAASIQHHDELMRSRPFVQFLLARAALELDPPPPDTWHHGDSRGMFLYQGPGIQLPLYVPGRDGKKPAWQTLYSPSTPEQRRAVEVAAGTAHHLGDYQLHAQALKLLVLQSEAPHTAIGALADLQNKAQGDHQGFYSTNLSGFLVANTHDEQRELLRILELPEGARNSLEFENLRSKPLKWAWAVLRIFLIASAAGEAQGGMDHAIAAAHFKEDMIRIDISNLNPRIQEFSRDELKILDIWGHHSSRPRSTPLPVPLSHRARHVVIRDSDYSNDDEDDDDGGGDDDDDDNDDDYSSESTEVRIVRRPRHASGPNWHSGIQPSGGTWGVHDQGSKPLQPPIFIQTVTRDVRDVRLAGATTKRRQSVKFAPRERRRSMPPPPRRPQSPPSSSSHHHHHTAADHMTRYMADDNARQVMRRADERVTVVVRPRTRPVSPAGTGFARTVTSGGEEEYHREEEGKKARVRERKEGGKGGGVVGGGDEASSATKHEPPAVEDDPEVTAPGEDGNVEGRLVGDSGVVVEEID